MVESQRRPLVVSGLNVLVTGIIVYYCFMKGLMDMVAVCMILFLVSVVTSACLVYGFIQKRALLGGLWRWVSYVIFGFLAPTMLLAGFLSENVVTMVFGTFLLLAIASSFLNSYVKGDHIAKRTFEVILLIAAIVVIVYGYAVTRSLILGIALLFIAAMFSLAFALSYLLPKVHSKFKSSN